MDFFQSQEKAHRNTKLLVVYFAVAVVLIIASVYAICLLVLQKHHPGVWDPQIFSGSSVVTLVIIIGAYLYKTAELSRGGAAVAESLGGRLLVPGSVDPDERKLLNVVEEMSIASGVPVPPVYVMDEEPGINAFAAGRTSNDAVISVTRGCMKMLTRDELQGVIAHEFSHILNGDMRMNLRLIGIIFGIMCLAIVGRMLLRVRSRGKNNPMPILGFGLLIIGSIGVFFGKLIQAAVSRQREFLADASAVQFTRNPGGIAGALKKIGGLTEGSHIESAHASEASHLFFGNGMGESLFGLMSTHPPLDQRIRAIDPGWDGRFTHVSSVPVMEEGRSRSRASGFPPVLPFPFPHSTGLAQAVVQTQAVLPTLGKPTPMHLRYAEELRNSLPDVAKTAARDPSSAVAMIYAMLLSPDGKMRASQLDAIAQQTDSSTRDKTVALYQEIAPLLSRVRLPLVELAMPALRQLTLDEFKEFEQTLQWLIESDQEVDLFEFALQRTIRHHLGQHFGTEKPPVQQYYTLRPLIPDCEIVLSALAQLSSSDAAEAEKAFRKGAPYLRSPDGELRLLLLAECGLDKITTALDRIALAVPQIKKNVIEAAVYIVGADGIIQEREAELLRAIADSLDCPIPPFVQMD